MRNSSFKLAAAMIEDHARDQGSGESSGAGSTEESLAFPDCEGGAAHAGSLHR